MGKLALPPGFRFHPTDEELVSYYLRRKISGRRIEFEAIGDLDLYKFEPWDLPELSRLQTKDLEWYFFCPRDKKYPNGSRTNRATDNGYWKATGKDRPVGSRSGNVGMKKTLVYYKGRAPKGTRTNWVMHEYRLEDSEGDHSTLQNGYVLCRIYQKSGAGPKNGEQYGAPVEEEEWETAPGGEIDDLNRLGATFSSAFCLPGAPAEIYDSKRLILKDENVDESDQTKMETLELKKSEEGVQFTKLPVEMIAELRGRAILNDAPSGNGEAYNISEPDHDVRNFIASILSSPEEAEILEEIQELVTTPENCTSQFECIEGGTVGSAPRDGDFFELADLSPRLDFDNNWEQDDIKNDASVFYLAGNLLSPRLGLQGDVHVVHTKGEQSLVNSSDCSFIAGAGEGFDPIMQAQEMSKIQPSSTTSLVNPLCQVDASKHERLLPISGIYGTKCETCYGAGEHHDEFLQSFEQLSSFSANHESFNIELLAGRLPTSLQSEHLNVDFDTASYDDENFLDPLMSFSDITEENFQTLGMSPLGDSKDKHLSVLNEDRSSSHNMNTNCNKCMADAATKLPMNRPFKSTEDPQNALPCSSGSDKEVPSPEDRQGALKVLDSRGVSKALGAILNCLESLPILPASAADVPPKPGTSVGSISVLANTVDIRADVKCSCPKQNASLPCMSCSFAKRGTFVSSLSYTGGRRVVKNPSNSFLALTIFGVLWVLLWLIMVGGAWKLVGSVYRLIFF